VHWKGLLTDLLADLVLLLVQHVLLGFGDVTTVLARHVALFLPNLMVFFMQGICLLLGDLAFLQLLIDGLFWLFRRALTSARRGWFCAHFPSAIALVVLLTAKAPRTVAAETAMIPRFMSILPTKTVLLRPCPRDRLYVKN